MRISICIPTVSARRSDYFREAIASVAEQTYTNFEIVIADNSADSGCHARVDEIMREFPQITFHLIRHPRQLHVSENLNSLIDAARGDAWLLLPDDDLLCPTFLARAHAALESHPRCGFTFADHWLIDGRGRINEPATEANTVRYGRASLREGVYAHDRLFELALDQAICLQTMVIRKEVLAANRFPRGVVSADYAFALKLGTGTSGVDGYYLKERVFKYRVHGDQITSSVRRRVHAESLIASLEDCGPVPPASEPRFRQLLAERYMSLALLEAEARDGLARKHALHSLRLDPGVRRALGATLAVALPWAVSPVRRVRAALVAQR
jgi:glycosyltransferase involved in cell wall biosynthesis